MKKLLIDLVSRLMLLGYFPSNGFGRVTLIFEHGNIVDVEVMEKKPPRFDK